MRNLIVVPLLACCAQNEAATPGDAASAGVAHQKLDVAVLYAGVKDHLRTAEWREFLAPRTRKFDTVGSADLTRERAQGFDVIQARDGAELLDLVGPAFLDPSETGSVLPAELVISALRMPGITGLSVLGGLRDLDLRSPFILITACGDADTHALAHHLGATAVLDKPFDMPSFLGLVRACLATY